MNFISAVRRCYIGLILCTNGEAVMVNSKETEKEQLPVKEEKKVNDLEVKAAKPAHEKRTSAKNIPPAESNICWACKFGGTGIDATRSFKIFCTCLALL